MFKEVNKYRQRTNRISLHMSLLCIVISFMLVDIAAAGRDKPTTAKRAAKRHLTRGSKAAQSFAAPTATSAAKKPRPLRRPRPGGTKQRRPGNRSQKFSEVEIVLSEDFALADISALSRAPGNNLTVLNNPRRVRVQLPISEIKALVEQGAEVTMLRSFVLIEGVADETNSMGTNVATVISNSIVFESGANALDVDIPDDGSRAYSIIDFSGVPSGYTVTSVDVHYQIESSSGFVYADLSNEDDTISYPLVDGVNGYISETKTGITAFNGNAVDQMWILWASEEYSSGGGYIDYWWIKVYYESGTTGYCAASSEFCSGIEYISNVQTGTINNSSGCDLYGDYTATSTEMQIGTDYPIIVTNSSPLYSSDECGIWVDWNQDMDFNDTGETITVSGSPGVGPYTATITPPDKADLGDTRMRIRIIDSNFDTLNSCGTSSWGDVEDYTITVAEAVATSQIHGTKFNDLNGNGVRDGGEPGLERWEIYIDTNGNDQHDIGEPNSITDTNGDYEFLELAPDTTYTIAEVMQDGWTQTLPGGDGTYQIIAEPNRVYPDNNFGNRIAGGDISAEIALDPDTWMYQNVLTETNSRLTADVLITDDPLANSSYTYEWEIILPSDVTTAPSTFSGGGSSDQSWTFAAPNCNEPTGISELGETFQVKVRITGNNYGNTGLAQLEFGIALLGDVNNDKKVNVADRGITNAFWRTGSAGPFTLADCDVNCDGVVNVADRGITNAIWRGSLGSNSIANPCPLR